MAGEGAGGRGGAVVIGRDQFEATISRHYEKAKKKLFAKAEELLALGKGKVRANINGFVNSLLAVGLQEGIKQALGAGSSVVSFTINTNAEGRRLWKSWPPNLRNATDPTVVVLAVELMLLEAGYPVSVDKHLVEFSYDPMDQGDDEPEEVEVVEEEGGLEAAADELPALTGSVEESGEGMAAEG